MLKTRSFAIAIIEPQLLAYNVKIIRIFAVHVLEKLMKAQKQVTNALVLVNASSVILQKSIALHSAITRFANQMRVPNHFSIVSCQFIIFAAPHYNQNC